MGVVHEFHDMDHNFPRFSQTSVCKGQVIFRSDGPIAMARHRSVVNFSYLNLDYSKLA